MSINIEGIDTKAALVLYDGKEKIYLSILRAYTNNVMKVLNALRDVSSESLAEYAINVHGLKGISAAISAEKIIGMAQKLELMAKAGDLDGVRAQNEDLIKEAEILVSNIKAWFAEYDSRISKPLLTRPQRDILESLKRSLEKYDMDAIDEAMDFLESSNYDQGAYLIKSLREKIDSLEFSQAVERITSYLEEAN